MAEVRFLPPAAKFIKKIKDKKLKALYREAIDKISENHLAGEAKTGDLSGVYGYDIITTKPITSLLTRLSIPTIRL